MQKKNTSRTFSVTAQTGLDKLEMRYRTFPQNEVVPYAIGTSYAELASVVFPSERGPDGCWLPTAQPRLEQGLFPRLEYR